MADDVRFRQSNDYARVYGFFTGFPNFHQADYGNGLVYGTILLRGGTGVEWRDVKRTDYNVYTIENIPAMFRGAGDYASRMGYRAGFPNFHQADHGQGVVYGTILLRENIVEWRDVRKDELGSPNIDDVGNMMRAANDYAFRNGFAAAFPTFHHADYGQGVVYGIVLFRPGTVIGRDVPADLLSMYSLPSDPWAIILCHLSDVSPQPNSAQRYINYFSETGSGTGGAFDYWRDMSYGVGGSGDMRGTRVFGWFNIGHSRAELSSFSGQTQRAQIFTWGLETARRNSVPLDQYKHKIIILNVSADHGQSSGGVVLAYEDSRPLEPTFFFHEMGHELGFDHSFGEHSTPCAGGDDRPGAYCNTYDIMSAMNVLSFNDSQNRRSGPSLNAPTRESMKWIHKSRIWTNNSENFKEIRLTLAPLNKPAIDGYLMVKIFNSNADPAISNYTGYTIEFRQRSGWDRGISGDVALIHGIPPNGPIKLLTNTRGGEIKSGEEYVIPGSRIRGRVESINATTSQLVLKLWTTSIPTPIPTPIISDEQWGTKWTAKNTDGRLEVFRISSNTSLYHIWQLSAGGAWGNWTSRGGSQLQRNSLTVGQNTDGRLEVFVIGGDGAMYSQWQTSAGGAWSNWTSRGGSQLQRNSLTVTKNADGRLEVFVIGGDGALYHIWQTSAGGAWSNWQSLSRV